MGQTWSLFETPAPVVSRELVKKISQKTSEVILAIENTPIEPNLPEINLRTKSISEVVVSDYIPIDKSVIIEIPAVSVINTDHTPIIPTVEQVIADMSKNVETKVCEDILPHEQVITIPNDVNTTNVEDKQTVVLQCEETGIRHKKHKKKHRK